MHQISLDKVQYLERPATKDEKEIADVLEKIVYSIKTKDLYLLASVFADSAVIVMTASDGQPVSKSDYIKKMEKIIQNVIGIYYKDVFIRVDGSAAAVSLLSEINTRQRSNILTKRYYKFGKINNSWLIVETMNI